MAGSNFSQIMQGVGGAMGVAGALAGSYFNTPKAASNKPFLKKANQVGLWNYGISDMTGLMSQIENTPVLNDITGKALYNPSGEEVFGSLFGAGMSSYGAAKSATAPLKGVFGISGAPVGKVEGMQTTGGQAMSDYDFSNLVQNGGQEGIINPIVADTSKLRIVYPQACGGHLHGCGGHKYAFGGFDWGSGLSELLSLATGGLGVALNYLGQKSQIDKAGREAAEVNAANAYARQLASHNQLEAVNDTKNNMAKWQGLQMMAMGGDLQTHGAEFPLFGDFNVIGAGGTHEQNPFGGVYQGMAVDGKPNLVEQDEVVWNDYVFSNRIPVDKIFAQQYKLKDGITYAEAAKKLSKGAEERPNDPISQNSLAAVMNALMDSQEEVKARREAAKIKRKISKMSPEELMNMVAMLQGGQQASPFGQPFACGGHLYPDGGSWNFDFNTLFNIANPYAASNLAQNLPYDRAMAEDVIRAEEAKEAYAAWTQYVKDNWDSEDVQNYLKALDAKAGGNHLFDKEGKAKKGAKEYFEKARTDGKWGYYHLTPEQLAAVVEGAQEVVGNEGADNVDNAGNNNNDNNGEDTGKKTAEDNKDAKKKGFPWYQTFSRYAPLFGNAIGTILASRPAKDYSMSFVPRLATYAPIGNYLPYIPVDTQRYINAQNQQTAAQLNAIMNASAGNKNIAMAQGALARQQGLQGIGQVMQGAEAINWDRLRQASEFNRGTNMFNAQAFNQAELANLGVNPLMFRQAQQNAVMKHTVDAERDAAISENINALLDSLAGIGQENFAFNQANSNQALRYGANRLGISGYKGAFGGDLLTKPKKNRR